MQFETVWLPTLGENNRHWHFVGNPGLSFFSRRSRSFSTAKSFQSAQVALTGFLLLDVFKLIAWKMRLPTGSNFMASQTSLLLDAFGCFLVVSHLESYTVYRYKLALAI